MNRILALKLTGILGLILLFNSCDEPQPQPCEPKIVYVKNTIPKQRFLNDINKFKITDVRDHQTETRYYIVNKSQLKRASETSYLIRKQNTFYKNQVQTFNKQFTTEVE